MSKHKPYTSRYREYLLFLLNTDPTTYRAKHTIDDWMWYRDEAVSAVQYKTFLRRFPDLPPPDTLILGQKRRREEYEAALRRPNAVDCAGREMKLDASGMLTVERAARFHLWLHDLDAEEQLEMLRCCPVCARFFYAHDGHQRFCSSEARALSRPTTKRDRKAYMRRYRQHPPVKKRVTTRKRTRLAK
jgi:hypothetical protein